LAYVALLWSKQNPKPIVKVLRIIIVSLLFFWVNKCIQAQEILVYESPKVVSIGPYMRYFEDTTHRQNVQTLQQLPVGFFQKAATQVPNFGISRSTIWLKVSLQNRTNHPLFLLCDEENIFKIQLYVISSNDSVAYHHTGFLEAYQSRFFRNNQLTLPLGAHPKTLYIGISGDATLLASFFIASAQPLANWMHLNDTFEGLFLGWMLLVLLYNLFIYFQLRDRLYLFYCLYVVTCSFLILRLEGIGFDLLWPQSPSFNRWIDTPALFNTFTVFWFATQFLQTKAILPRWYRVTLIFMGVTLAIILLEIFDIRPLSNQATMLMFLVGGVLLWWVAVGTLQKGFRQARFYLLGWSFFIIGAIVTTLWKLGIINSNHWLVYHSLPLGVMIEAALFSFALADRIRIFRQEADNAQTLALQRLEQNEKLLFDYNELRQQNAEMTQREPLLVAAPTPLKRLSVPSMNGIVLLPLDDIVRLQALGSYCNIYLSHNKKIMASKPMGDFEAFLITNGFLRVHKSHLINLHHVQRYVKGDGGTAVMTDGSEVSVSRSNKIVLMERLEIQ
jgi:two-component system, sensor histidine kinase LadS